VVTVDKGVELVLDSGSGKQLHSIVLKCRDR